MKPLDLSNIPATLHSLVPLAERFGISDFDGRRLARQHAQEAEIEQLCTAIRKFDDELDIWLAGAESNGPTFSDEYIAFSAMRMLADGA